MSLSTLHPACRCLLSNGAKCNPKDFIVSGAVSVLTRPGVVESFIVIAVRLVTHATVAITANEVLNKTMGYTEEVN
jgi:hypothetical protein